MPSSIKLAQSTATDAKAAAKELYEGISDSNLELVLFFCSSEYDLNALAEEINALFPDITVIGCTTAGEIGPKGYLSRTLAGVSFSSSEFKAVATNFDEVSKLNAEMCGETIRQLKTALDHKLSGKAIANRFALQFIDGLSNSEEFVTYLVQRGLGDIPLIGGSAGNDLKFESSQIFCNGAFHSNASVLTIIDTICPIKIFKTQHFIDGNEPLVVTAADVATRTVKELNGLPAAAEYARSLGVSVNDLNATIFAEAPVVIHLNGNEYVRSIQKANPDGSLSFYCAIDLGLVLRNAHGVDLIENLKSTYDEIRQAVGLPQVVLAFDCVFRRLEIEKENLRSATEFIMQSNNTLGFNTYGEQFLGIHVNQTLTGIAIGLAADE
jgi:hypothetical protein